MRRTVKKATQIAVLALIGTVFVVSVAATGASAAGSSIYVDRGNPSCSDSNSGDVTHPLCTISKAASIATGGQTVQVAAGTYNEDVKPSNSGSSGAPIVFQAAPNAIVTVGQGQVNAFTISSRSYITVQGFTVMNTTGSGLSVSGSSNISLLGNSVSFSGTAVSGGTKAGISLSNTNSSLVRGNTSFQNSDHGIYVSGTSTGNTISGNVAYLNAEQWQRNANGINVTAPGNSLIGNITHDNEDSGINVYPGANNTLVATNASYNNGDHGIDDLNVTGGRIIGNTVFHNCTDGINVEGTSGNYTVENNISVDNSIAVVNPTPMASGLTNNCNRRKGNIGIYDSAPSSTTADYNISYMSVSTDATNKNSKAVWYVWAGTSYTAGGLSTLQSASGQESHGIWADPLWSSAGLPNPDFHLTSGSPAIDSANTSISGQQPTDIEGTSPYDDRGAYELSGSPPQDQPPVAALTLTPPSGYAPLGVTADASSSTDTDATPIATYTFDFGDGTIVGPQAGATAQHTYNVVGNYTVTVTVADRGGLSGTATKTAIVQKALTAALSVTPPTGYAPLGVTADGSSSAGQNQITAYTFDFGDGTAVVGPQPGATATHTYTVAGTYTAVLTVKDSLGNTATAQKSVTASPDLPPSAALSVTPSSGKAPLQVAANASGSTDPDPTPIQSYTFNFGDGTTVGPQASAQASHTYQGAGTYTVTLTVTDTANHSSTATATVSVADSAPSAALSVTPNSGTAPVATVANASGSTDPDSTPIASYTFDFGDGTALVGPQATATAPHNFQAPGVYTVKVTVKDTANLSSTATATVTIFSANLVGNPGFETNTNGWAPLGDSSAITLTQVAGGHSGTSAALIQNTSGNKKQTCGLNDSPSWVKTTSAGFYTAQIWVRADQPGTSFKLALTEYSGSRNVGSASKSVTLTTSWQLVTVNYTIKQPGSTLDFNGYTTQRGGNCFYADDISIVFA